MENSNEFCVGMRIMVTPHGARRWDVLDACDTGVVVCKGKIGYDYGVEFDKSSRHMHSCDGHAKTYHGWWVCREDIEPEFGVEDIEVSEISIDDLIGF